MSEKMQRHSERSEESVKRDVSLALNMTKKNSIDEISILLPSKKFYKKVDLSSGIFQKIRQGKNEDEKIKNVMIYENSKNQLLFRCEKNEITLVATTKCNQKCVMCPQKLDIDSSENDLIIRRVLENLDYKFFTGITFTGGEPFLKIGLIEFALEKSAKNVFITILSNGSILPSEKILRSGRVKLCVPLYAPFDEIHNFLTGSSSFYKVVKNLMRISSFDVLIELRFVMTKLNSKYLLEFSRFVARNLPFVQDVAFMGMELTESAAKNKNALWINPKEYVLDLEKAADYLSRFKITAWIYNLPFCLFDKNHRKYLVKSISPWKIRFLEKCQKCEMKGECGGMFFSDVGEMEKII